jgi:hypothetical protein
VSATLKPSFDAVPTVLDTAIEAVRYGLTPIPVGGNKKPLGQWKQWQNKTPTEAQVRDAFNGAQGVGLVCGKHSRLLMLELEGRAVKLGYLQKLSDACRQAGIGELFERVDAGYVEVTPSGGLHFLIRTDEPAKNVVLARDADGNVMIETRGEGGYTVVAPSDGLCHPTGTGWRLEQGSLETIAELTAVEVTALLAACRSLDQQPQTIAPTPVHRTVAAMSITDGQNGKLDPVYAGTSPLDSWKEQHGAADVLRWLEKSGWHHPVRDGKGTQLTRPGKEHCEGSSATVFHDGPVEVYSTNANIPAGHYSVLEVFAWTHHGGNTDEAIAKIVADDRPDRYSDNASARTVNRLGDDGGGPGKAGRPSTATKLVNLARDQYRFAIDENGKAFAIPLAGSSTALAVDGGFADTLAHVYYSETNASATKAAIQDALQALRGEAKGGPSERIHLRRARTDDAVHYDLGDPAGTIVTLRDRAWQVNLDPTVLFRRTALTQPMPKPVRPNAQGEGIAELRALLNVADEPFRLLIAWLVAYIIDATPPILFLGGEQGVGKSAAARLLVGILDPATPPLRAAPKDVENWVVSAAGSSVVALDNMSSISVDMSDALCRAVTGEGLVRRALYSNDELSVISIKRTVVLTSIDAGALRGDLAERLLLVELGPIASADRRTDEDLQRQYDDALPAIVGDLFDVASLVLHELPNTVAAELPRLAEFGKVLATIDRLYKWSTFDSYRAMLDDLNRDVALGDPLAVAVVELVEQHGSLRGTPTSLFEMLDPKHGKAHSFPKTPRALTAHLTRLAPALRAVGVQFNRYKSNGVREVELARIGGDSAASSTEQPR